MTPSIISAQRPGIDAFLQRVAPPAAPQTREIGPIDIRWKEQRYYDLLEKANRVGLSDDEKDEADELGADLNEAANEAAWMECERRGGF